VVRLLWNCRVESFCRRDLEEVEESKMTPNEPHAEFPMPVRSLGPFRRAVIRGLALLLPPLLTIAIFLWVGNTVNNYLLEPFENKARWLLAEKLADIRNADAVPAGQIVENVTEIDGDDYRLTGDDKLIPLAVYDEVKKPKNLGTDPMPTNAQDIYLRYVNQTWLQPEFVIPIFLCLFVLVLYLLGKFLAAGVGRFFWTQLERIIHRVPLVRSVYSSVKQVTDFLFTDPDLEYTRVVAVEYPRKGIWTMAFVTGDSLNDIRLVAGEAILSVLIPTSPMPFTGFTVNVKKSETIDLDITVDQAFQFVISCGVVVPPHQLAEALAKQADRRSDKSLALSSPVGSDD
jgi:uncharacterized membrane protein